VRMMSILAIGAHPDDVEIGCGGTLARLRKQGCEVQIVHMSAGYHFVKASGRLVRSREEGMREAVKAAKILVGANPIILDYPPQSIPFNEDMVSALDKLIKRFKVDTVYAVWENDTNQDHINVHRAAMAACRNVPNVYCYETPRRMKITLIPFRPQRYVDITSEFETKMKALRAYKKIVKYYGEEWLSQVEIRAEFRGIECGCRYAEAFEVIREVMR